MCWKRSISLLSLLFLSVCSKPCPPCPPVVPERPPGAKAAALPPLAANKMRVTVTIAITGLAHLIDDGGGKLVIFPNGTKFARPDTHELLLLVPTVYKPTKAELPYEREQKVGSTLIDTFRYKTLAPGIEIDLAKSGFDSTLNPTLLADATGDSTNETCPSPQLAPATSLHWLPDLKKVSHATGKVIDPDQIQPKPDKDVISCRLKITGGALTATLTASGEVFDFETGGSGDLKQAVAERLNFTYLVDVEKSNPVVELWGGPYGAASAKLATATASVVPKRVTFYLANVPPDDFFAPPKKNTLPHFHHFYKIYKPRTGSHRVAVPTRNTKPEDSCGPPLGGGVECGPDRP